jgi:hypothetical protein
MTAWVGWWQGNTSTISPFSDSGVHCDYRPASCFGAWRRRRARRGYAVLFQIAALGCLPFCETAGSTSFLGAPFLNPAVDRQSNRFILVQFLELRTRYSTNSIWTSGGRWRIDYTIEEQIVSSAFNPRRSSPASDPAWGSSALPTSPLVLSGSEGSSIIRIAFPTLGYAPNALCNAVDASSRRSAQLPMLQRAAEKWCLTSRAKRALVGQLVQTAKTGPSAPEALGFALQPRFLPP